MEMKIRIDRCMCNNVTFKEIHEIIVKKDLTSMQDLVKEKKVASNCRLCKPYIEKMIETGQTEFFEILTN